MDEDLCTDYPNCWFSLGTIEVMSVVPFRDSSSGRYGVTIDYGGGSAQFCADPRTSEFVVLCNSTLNATRVVSYLEYPACRYHFLLESPLACPSFVRTNCTSSAPATMPYTRPPSTPQPTPPAPCADTCLDRSDCRDPCPHCINGLCSNGNCGKSCFGNQECERPMQPCVVCSNGQCQ